MSTHTASRWNDSYRSFRRGDIAFRQGDPADRMYVIVAGQAQVSVDGRPIETLFDGEIFGEMAVIDGAPRGATVTALSDLHLRPMNEQAFRQHLSYSPLFSLQVMRVMAKRLRRGKLQAGTHSSNTEIYSS